MFDSILEFIMGRFIYCPRCLKRLQIRSEVTQDMTCEGCQYPIPRAYITGCRDAPPVFVQVFGLPLSGKTTFLDMLSLILQGMDQVWQESGFYCRQLNQQTVEQTTILRTSRLRGDLAGSTPRRALNQAEVLIFDLRNMPRWGSRILVIMDHAGEQFARLSLDLEDIPFLQHTPITILLLSISDMMSAGQRVDDLVNSYLSTLKMYQVPLTRQRRQLIIAFSKADMLTNNLPPELNKYLSSDTTHLTLINRRGNLQVSEGQLPNYLPRMQQVSDAIRNWVETTLPTGRNMLNMLDDHGVDTRFTLISSTGGPLTSYPGGSDLAPRPRRVLDPFFWVLEFYRHRGSRSTVPATLRMILETFSPALRSFWSLLLLFLLFAGSLRASLFLAGLSGGAPDLVRPDLSLLALLVYILAAQWLTHADSALSLPRSQPVSSTRPRLVELQQTNPYPVPGATVSLSPQASATAPVAPAPVARSVLNTSRLALFFACLVAFTVPAVQHALAQFTLGQFLQFFLVGAALFSCFQPSARMASMSRVTLALIAGCGALLQYSYGSVQELLDLHLPPASPETYTTITNAIALALLVLAGILLLILTTGRNGWDRFTLWLVTLAFAGLQLAYGPWELLQMFPSAGQSFVGQHVELVNMILAALLALLPLAVLVYLYRFTYLDRLPLLILAIVCAVQLHFLGDGASLPAGLSLPFVPADAPLLATPVMSLLAPDHLIAYALLALAGLMTIRWLFGRPPGPFVFLDHAVLFFLAVLCTQLQNFPWGAPVPQGLLSSFQANLLTANHIVASILTLQVYLGTGLALFLLLFPLARQIKRLRWLLRPLSDRFTWLTRQSWYQRGLTRLSEPLARHREALPWSQPQTVRLTQGIVWLRPITAWSHRALAWLHRTLSTLDVVMRVLERLLACTTTLACALLADLYGQIGSGDPQSMTINGVMTANQLVALLFIIFAVIIICRVKFPLARGSRFLLLLDIILCTLLYLGRALPPLPLAFTLQNWSAVASHSPVPTLLFVSLCSATAIISFWWAERSPFPGDRRLLQVLFTLALVGGFLQLLSNALLVTLLALQTLVMGMAIATIGARSNSTGA